MANQTGSATLPAPTALARIWAKLATKGRAYWVMAGLVLVLGMIVTRYGAEFLRLDKARNSLSQWLLQEYWRPLEARTVRLVFIHNDEFWHGPLAGRSPVKRDYLAHLVRALDSANARVIALDFDMRLPDPQSVSDFGDYGDEEGQLAAAVVTAAQHHKLVLSKTVRWAGAGSYRLEPDVYQIFGICSEPGKGGHWKHTGTRQLPITERAASNINCGYIALTFDMRELPNELPLTGGAELDSFALAITRAQNPHAAEEVIGERVLGSYLPASTFFTQGVTYSAHQVIGGDPATLAALNGQVVIVGADWNTLADGRGAITDTHETPVGRMSGAEIHANFAEAFLDSRTYRRVPEGITVVLEALLCAGAAVTFALLTGLRRKFLALIIIAILMVGVEWISLNLFGVFLEVFIPIAGVWIHSLLERTIVGGEAEKK